MGRRNLSAVMMIGASLATTAPLLGATSAQAIGRQMPIGVTATPPAGFLDLCRRSPEECAEIGVALADIQQTARQQFWAIVFDRTPDRPASMKPASVGMRPRAAPDRSGFGRSSTTGAYDAEKTTERMSLNTPSATPPITRDQWIQIDQINRGLNREIRHTSDQRLYGTGDFWAVPTGRSPRGDCEDYVLAKRRALINLGYSQTAFSIALVVTSWGEDHAVLLMSTPQGEMVLDNLSQEIVAWDRTDYRWVKRQLPGRSLAWVEIG